MQYMYRIYAAHAYHSLMDKDHKDRWRDCSYTSYYQRPNLTEGEFKSIMPNEDERAFENVLELINGTML